MSQYTSKIWNSGRDLANYGRTAEAGKDAKFFGRQLVEVKARGALLISTIPTTIRATAQAVIGTFARIGQAASRHVTDKYENAHYPAAALKDANTVVGTVYQSVFQTVSRSTRFKSQKAGYFTQTFTDDWIDKAYGWAHKRGTVVRFFATRVVTLLSSVARIVPQTLDAGIGLFATGVSIAARPFGGQKTADSMAIEGLNTLLAVSGALFLTGLMPAKLNNRWFKGFAIAGLAVSRVDDIANLIYAKEGKSGTDTPAIKEYGYFWWLNPFNWFAKSEEKQD